MQRILIAGANEPAVALIDLLREFDQIQVVAVIDSDPHAPGMIAARDLGIPTATELLPFYEQEVDVIIETTTDAALTGKLARDENDQTIRIPAKLALPLIQQFRDQKELIAALVQRERAFDTMVNSTHDAIIAVDEQGIITLFNKAAERLMGIDAADVIGTHVTASIPNTRLHLVLASGVSELNREQLLADQTRIITNRMPVRSEDGQIVGAVAVFRDITEALALAEEVTELKEVKSMLQAVIDCSNEAISVVDANGIGQLFNPEYMRITGLSLADVVGKPANVDIAEGESMHYQVLKTQKAVRGARMKLGQKRKDVMVNVAPVMVDGVLRGSVGVVHDLSEIKKLTEELEKARRIIRKLEAKYTFADIVGKSEPFQTAIEQAKTAAQTPATVLLRGESGTGKELFAHAIHNDSERKYSQFIRVNCAALTESLLESELFGYEPGAFTGALRGGKRGLFEEASGGTIFLDEIGELSSSMQVKLLRVLQEREIVRVGGTKAIPINVRVIAATHVNLESAIAKGVFREDLYYRLNVVPIHIPPLRQRREDIPLLSVQLIKRYNEEYGRKVEQIDPLALQSLCDYDWPGNVRELENVLGRAIINMKYSETIVLLNHLPPLQKRQQQTDSNVAAMSIEGNLTLKEAMEEAEKAIIQQALAACKGNRTKAANQLGISLRSLYYKLEKMEPENKT